MVNTCILYISRMEIKNKTSQIKDIHKKSTKVQHYICQYKAFP